MKAVKSTDPRKAAIVAALKKKSGCSKITNVKQVTSMVFVGHCLKREELKFSAFVTGYRWTDMGEFSVLAGEDFKL